MGRHPNDEPFRNLGPSQLDLDTVSHKGWGMCLPSGVVTSRT
jgi:hypothetical protein